MIPIVERLESYGKKKSFNWRLDILNNKWTILSFILPAIVAPIVSHIIGEASTQIKKKYKKRKRK